MYPFPGILCEEKESERQREYKQENQQNVRKEKRWYCWLALTESNPSPTRISSFCGSQNIKTKTRKVYMKKEQECAQLRTGTTTTTITRRRRNNP